MDALLLIDLQEDFFEPPGLAEARAGVVAETRRWVEHAHEIGASVLEVRTEVPEDDSTWALNMRDDQQPVALEGTAGARRVAELADLDVPTIVKRRDDAFLGTDLESWLHELHAERLVVAGISTEACVAVTAASAYARDFRVALAGGAVASADPQSHEQALDWLATQYRQVVIPVPTG